MTFWRTSTQSTALFWDSILLHFCADRKTVYAATRALEIISEASRRLENELKERHPHVDWPAGNVYRHEYESVDEAQLWHTIQHELDALGKLSVRN
jgi:uncharacterized protein with HEPN domain